MRFTRVTGRHRTIVLNLPVRSTVEELVDCATARLSSPNVLAISSHNTPLFWGCDEQPQAEGKLQDYLGFCVYWQQRRFISTAHVRRGASTERVASLVDKLAKT